MENFIAYNPTKLFFGKNIIENMHENIKTCGKNALIIYGKNSAKKYGYFQKVVNELNAAQIEYVEFAGIKPNPIVDDVRNAVEVCKNNNIDFIIALGGGSVIDTAKIVMLAYANDADPWDIMKYKFFPKKSVPLVVVLTFAGTGSEMNGAAVIQNSETHEKIGYFNELLFPSLSFLDPSFTLSLPKQQTIYGIVDMFAHSLEAFFAYGEAPLSDKFVGATLNEIMEVAPLLLENLQNYDYRARIMWAATVALNGSLYHGRKSSGDWGVHAIGHVFSYLFDTPHGASLSIAYPAWLKYMSDKIPQRIETLGMILTGDKISAKGTIRIIEDFFRRISAPIYLSEIGLCKNDLSEIKKYLVHTKASGMNYALDADSYDAILSFML
jgi:hypothetical protein